MKQVEKRGKGPRGLAKADITRAAISELESVGEAGFTLRKVAARLGCDPMTIVYHFRSKEGLFRAMAGWISEQLDGVDATRPWDGRLVQLAEGLRSLALGYPSTFRLMQRFMNTGVSDYKHSESVLQALEEAGVSEEQLAQLCLGWYACVIGLALAEVDGLLQPASQTELEEIEMLDPTAFPITTRCTESFRNLPRGAVFSLTLETFLLGIRGRAAGGGTRGACESV
ncbi:TetR/AcrR family transcriptional regulator [Stenotrophomonas maltophilia]|nr:TetR/AcrR family transcriptional regulator [Stenotrophomonas maltophilia]